MSLSINHKSVGVSFGGHGYSTALLKGAPLFSVFDGG